MAYLRDSKDAVRDRLAVLGSGRMIVRVFGALFLLLLLYYVVGATWVNRIDDDPSFAPAEVPPGGSRAVAMAAAPAR